MVKLNSRKLYLDKDMMVRSLFPHWRSWRITEWQGTIYGNMGLQALLRFAVNARLEVDTTITITSGYWQKQVEISQLSADVLQVLEVPIDEKIEMVAQGKGQVVVQVVRRFNLLEVEQTKVEMF